MATTYKEINSATPVILTAPVFADGIEIHPTHPLRSCTRWQWFFDDLTGGAAVALTGATDDSYTVDLSSIASSGEYYCEITIGNTGDCDQRTENRRISIVDCGTSTAAGSPYANGGAVGNVTIEHAHFETPTFSAEGLGWITLTDAPVPCLVEPGGCLSTATFSVAASSEARRGQVSLTVGDIVCYYNVVQNYAGGVAPVEAADPPAGPYINLSSNGPVLAGSFFGDITVTADVGTIGGDGTEGPYTISWTNAVSASATTATVANPNAGASIVVTAVVTDDSSGLTATDSITVFFTQLIPITTTIMGDTLGRVNWQVLQGLGPGGTVPGDRTVNGIFESSGAGNWTATSNWYEGFFGAASTAGSSTLTITGPGVNETLTVSPTSTSAMFEATNRTGTYRWELTITGVLPDRSYANVSALIYARQF